MSLESAAGRLKYVDPSLIDPSDDNPRLVFRQEEMEQLLASIDKHGIQVPITVYKHGGRYRLIDGERRWRCAMKLKLRVIPALIHEKPTELQSLLLMYNIHALREQWDYFTIASKLDRVIDLLKAELRRAPSEADLSESTGLTRGQIRRCRLILDLPERFKRDLLKELALPKSQQMLSEDFFLEMEKSLKTVVKRFPEYANEKNRLRDVLVGKFRNQSIKAVTDFRLLSKLATATRNIGLPQDSVRKVLARVFDGGNNYGIRAAYRATVEFGYSEKEARRNVEALLSFLDDVSEHDQRSHLDDDFIGKLKQLAQRLRRLLGS